MSSPSPLLFKPVVPATGNAPPPSVGAVSSVGMVNAMGQVSLGSASDGVAVNGRPYHHVSLYRQRLQQMLTPEQRESIKREEAIRLADRFCKASIKRVGADEHEMQLTVKEVAHDGLSKDFNIAVRNIALQNGLFVSGAGDVIDRELGGNFLTRFFKVAPRKACHDYLELGRNPHSATPWEYRRYGMYRSGSDFVGLIKRHPAVSLSVIGAVSYLGDRYPFVGAASGVALMAWAAVMSAINEFKATQFPSMNGPKSRCYEQSGENLAAIFLTLPGYHGINEGVRAGVNSLKNVTNSTKTTKRLNKPASSESKLEIGKIPKGLWHAVKLDKHSKEFAEFQAKHYPTPEGAGQHVWADVANRALFVAGLFDNVLLPFNWLADKLEDKD